MDFINSFLDLCDDLISSVPTLFNAFSNGIDSVLGGAKILPSMAQILPSGVMSVFCGMFAIVLFTVCLKAILAKV